jgi:hypothetical protein
VKREHVTLPADFPRFHGGQRLMTISAVAGVLGLLVSIVGFFVSPESALRAYLVGYAYWVFIALGALALVMANHTAGARWNVTIRRISESMGATAPLFLVLFIPLLLGGKHVWYWLAPGSVGEHVREELQAKAGYLNLPFFILRLVIYFVVWTLLSWSLRGWSLAQDADGEARWTVKMRKLSPPGIVLLALTLTFAAFDWLMALNPLWYSTIFGLYVFSGGFVASLALTAIVITGVRSNPADPLGRLISVDHQHNVGKLLLAFVAFWAYMGFSQYMLIWAGNLPEELPWITVRSRGVWGGLGVLLVVGHFVAPFLLLLSRDLKRRTGPLAALSAWMLFMHYVDTYWMIMPAWHPHELAFSLWHITSFVGVGGLAVAFGIWALRGRYAVPVKDPFLDDSLRYVQP